MRSNYNPQSSGGFTLIELLVAASITTIVVSIAGSGLVYIMQNNSKAEAETLRRVELNRALDFMSDEVRTAKTIAKDASASLATVAPGFNSAGKTPVLTLEIPGVSQRVIYYTTSPVANSVWYGPKVIRRWGPTFGTNGNYTNATNSPPVGCNNTTDCNPANWKGNTLVDLIVDSTPNPNSICPIGDPSVTSDDWSSNPAIANRQGFYTCVDPNGKIAEIYLLGKLADAYGNSLANPYKVSTKVFARANP